MSKYMDLIINYYVIKFKFFEYIDLVIRLLVEILVVINGLINVFDIDYVIGI